MEDYCLRRGLGGRMFRRGVLKLCALLLLLLLVMLSSCLPSPGWVMSQDLAVGGPPSSSVLEGEVGGGMGGGRDSVTSWEDDPPPFDVPLEEPKDLRPQIQIRINCGGKTMTDNAGRLWQGDPFFSSSSSPSSPSSSSSSSPSLSSTSPTPSSSQVVAFDGASEVDVWNVPADTASMGVIPTIPTEGPDAIYRTFRSFRPPTNPDPMSPSEASPSSPENSIAFPGGGGGGGGGYHFFVDDRRTYLVRLRFAYYTPSVRLIPQTAATASSPPIIVSLNGARVAVIPLSPRGLRPKGYRIVDREFLITLTSNQSVITVRLDLDISSPSSSSSSSSFVESDAGSSFDGPWINALEILSQNKSKNPLSSPQMRLTDQVILRLERRLNGGGPDIADNADNDYRWESDVRNSTSERAAVGSLHPVEDTSPSSAAAAAAAAGGGAGGAGGGAGGAGGGAGGGGDGSIDEEEDNWFLPPDAPAYLFNTSEPIQFITSWVDSRVYKSLRSPTNASLDSAGWLEYEFDVPRDCRQFIVVVHAHHRAWARSDRSQVHFDVFFDDMYMNTYSSMESIAEINLLKPGYKNQTRFRLALVTTSDGLEVLPFTNGIEFYAILPVYGSSLASDSDTYAKVVNSSLDYVHDPCVTSTIYGLQCEYPLLSSYPPNSFNSSSSNSSSPVSASPPPARSPPPSPTVIAVNWGHGFLHAMLRQPPDLRHLPGFGNLRALRLDRNELAGELPAEFAAFPVLEILNLTMNNFSGPVPTWISNVTTLRVVDLSFNQFVGPLPVEIATLASLQVLDLRSNRNLTGVVPIGIFQMPSLKLLRLEGTDLQLPRGIVCNHSSSEAAVWRRGKSTKEDDDDHQPQQPPQQQLVCTASPSQSMNEDTVDATHPMGGGGGGEGGGGGGGGGREEEDGRRSKIILLTMIGLSLVIVVGVCFFVGFTLNKRKGKAGMGRRGKGEEGGGLGSGSAFVRALLGSGGTFTTTTPTGGVVSVVAPRPDATMSHDHHLVGGDYRAERDAAIKVELAQIARQLAARDQPVIPFTWEQLAVMTNKFSGSSILGKGGFGCVYRGEFHTGRAGDAAVAVKVLSHFSRQGKVEFDKEIRVLSTARHTNLVRLIGYCHESSRERYALVYEFIGNGSLKDHLVGKTADGQVLAPMTWRARLNVAVGVARALAYLHKGMKPAVIHRDVKAENILLTENGDAKLGDFGIARLVDPKDTHVITRPMGTGGYLDPEYHDTQRLADKSDVYSFGVVLLELLSGKRVQSKDIAGQTLGLVDWARDLVAKGDLSEFVDPTIARDGPDRVPTYETFVTVALKCCGKQQQRPAMRIVLRDLEAIWDRERG